MRTLDEAMFVGGQVWPEQMADLAAQGIAMIVNNRPEGEMPGQPSAAEVAAAAEAAGIGYRFIPVQGLTREGIDQMVEALQAAEGRPVLAFCASGTRSTYMWALARSAGWDESGDGLAEKAAVAGYDLTPIRRFLR